MPYSETTWGYAKDTTSLDKWNDVLISYAGNTITTDAIGNTLWDGLFSYTWQHGRQLARAQNSIIDITYSYNADGIRTSKTVKNTISNTNILHTYDLDGTTIVRECIYDTTGSYVETELRYYYDAKGAPVAMRAFKHDENGALLKDITCYFATNLQGDVVALYDETGNRIASYTYDAWGNNIYKNSTATSNISTADAQWLMNINPFRYRGYYYDTETGLYYLQSRYYNPIWGRFINADGYINANGDLIGFNMYAYCSNNPVMYTDPTGMCFEWLDDVFEIILDVIDAAFGLPAVLGEGLVIKSWLEKGLALEDLSNNEKDVRTQHTRNLVYRLRGEDSSIVPIDVLGGDQYMEYLDNDVANFKFFAEYASDAEPIMYKAAYTNDLLTDEDYAYLIGEYGKWGNGAGGTYRLYWEAFLQGVENMG